jgi:uncharacterized protein (DUF362 family)
MHLYRAFHRDCRTSPIVYLEPPTVSNDFSGAAGPDELYNQSIVKSPNKKTYYEPMATKICVFSAAHRFLPVRNRRPDGFRDTLPGRPLRSRRGFRWGNFGAKSGNLSYFPCRMGCGSTGEQQMDESINRRTFIKRTAALGAATVIGGSLVGDLLSQTSAAAPAVAPVDLAAVTGTDCYASAIKAVELLGGMKRFVAKGAKVAILPNAVSKHPGASVNADIVMAAVRMCNEAGAAEICCLRRGPAGYWKRAQEDKALSADFDTIRFAGERFITVPIPRGKILKTAEVARELMEYDVFINIPIIKNHEGTLYTGALKNMMGACPGEPTNRFIHSGDTGNDDWYSDMPRMCQCIADLNLVRKPTLCITDCTEFLLTNGPMGPGKLGSAHTVVAGRDPVAQDSYCLRFLGMKWNDVGVLANAAAHGLGQTDLQKLNIKEFSLEKG